MKSVPWLTGVGGKRAFSLVLSDSECEEFPTQEFPCSRGHCAEELILSSFIPQQTFCEGQACFFHPSTYPQTS